MAQQPNIELEITDLPRPEPHPGPARSWRPGRPGDPTGPDDVPRGPLFGTPGPDAGFALRLLDTLGWAPAEGEHRADTEAALAAIIIARGSKEGRAPTRKDVDAALTLLGLGEVPPPVADAFATYRKHRFAGFAHDPERVELWLATLDEELIHADLPAIRAAIASGPDALHR